ncbi:hypothetical protein SAMD00023353_1800800 [Rosellinia necatrix]|uniref:Uncharacterized protein n=1 Tax=Rosellinia necatrix TaxID=77044 RepID=A0A1W2TE93_ROSNE|nr:hypothetical protein SAMD00023353_1800800 [Rosellinia necatrix]
MNTNDARNAEGVQATQDDVSPNQLHTVYPARLFHLLWHGTTIMPNRPLQQGLAYSYAVTISVSLGGIGFLDPNLPLPIDISFDGNAMLSRFDNLYKANEHALIRSHRIRMELEALQGTWDAFDQKVNGRGGVLIAGQFNGGGVFIMRAEQWIVRASDCSIVTKDTY